MKMIYAFLVLASLNGSGEEFSSARPQIRMPCICCDDHLVHDFTHHQTANTIPCLQAFLPTAPSSVLIIGHINDSIPKTIAQKFPQHHFVFDSAATQANKADWVIVLNVLEKEKSPQAVLAKIRERLNPGGTALILTGPRCPFLYSVFEHRVPSAKEYKALLAAEGFLLLHDIEFLSALWWRDKSAFLADMRCWLGEDLPLNATKLAAKIDFNWGLFMGESHWFAVKKHDVLPSNQETR